MLKMPIVNEQIDLRLFLEKYEKILRETQENSLTRQHLEVILSMQLDALAEYLNQQLRSAATAPPEALPSHFLINVAEVMFERYIGQSQFGALYQGSWKYQPVTIKFVEYVNTEEEREFFIRETQIMARLHNTYITPFYGASLGKSRLCMLTGAMEKGDLSNVLEQLSLETRLTMAKDLACGLAFLHAEGVIHGDIQPKTVGVTKYYEAKWIEFGLVKTRLASIATLQTMGQLVSPVIHYQAPETWRRRETLTEASDIYSFGVLLWTLMTGRFPYHALTDEDIRSRVSQGWREPIPDTVPQACATLIDACWSADTTRRPRAGDLVVALTAISLMPEPVRPISPTGEEYYLKGQAAEKTDAFDDAWTYYLRAAEKNYFKACNRLSLFRFEGRGSQSMDRKAAREWLEKGAASEHVTAMFNLARMHEKGEAETSTPDHSQALYWYEQVLEKEPADIETQKKVSLLRGIK